jgi:hypothetical protein
VDYIIFPSPRKTFFLKQANREFPGKRDQKISTVWICCIRKSGVGIALALGKKKHFALIYRILEKQTTEWLMCGYRKNLTHLQSVLLFKDSSRGMNTGVTGGRWCNLVVLEESPNTERQHASRKRGSSARKLRTTESITENIPPRTTLSFETTTLKMARSKVEKAG